MSGGDSISVAFGFVVPTGKLTKLSFLVVRSSAKGITWGTTLL